MIASSFAPSTTSPVLEQNTRYLPGGWVSVPKQKPYLGPPAANQRYAVNCFSESRSRAWVGFRCGVFCTSAQTSPLQFQSCRSSWSRFPSSGALDCFSLLFPPLATLILETVPLVTVRVRRVHASAPTSTYRPRHNTAVGKNIVIVCSCTNV